MSDYYQTPPIDFYNDVYFGQSYKQSRFSKSFIDKTGIIAEVLSHRYTMVTAPPKFGRTLAADMVCTFVEIPFNESGIRGTPWDISHFFNNLHISKFPALLDHCMGQSTVFFLELKPFYLMRHMNDVHQWVRFAIHKAFKRYEFAHKKYLLNLFSINELEMMSMMCDENKMRIDGAQYTLEYLISFLINILYKLSSNVVVIVDDYDALILHTRSIPDVPLDEVHTIQTEIINTFTNSNLVRHVFLLGTTKQYLESPELYQPYNCANLACYFGITDEEFFHLKYVFNIPEELYNEAVKWYSGYTRYSKRFYNTCSIMHFIKFRLVVNYWKPSTADIIFMFHMMQNSSKIRDIVARSIKSNVLHSYSLMLPVDAVFNLRNMANPDRFTNGSSIGYSLLYDMGILSNTYEVIESTSPSSLCTFHVYIATPEVKAFLLKMFYLLFATNI